MSNVRLAGTYVREIIGAQELELIGIEEFANRCCFTLRDGILTAECHLKRPDGGVAKLSREVDLRPAINYFAQQLAAWHTRQHGEEPTVAGWTDLFSKAASAAKKVAQSKTVKSLYKQAKPFAKYATKYVPGGQYVAAGMELATKAAKTYEQAKKGSQTALDAVKKVQSMAKDGDQKAQYAMRVMQNLKTAWAQKELEPQTWLATQQHQQVGSLYDAGLSSVSGETSLVGRYYDIIGASYDLVGATADDFEHDSDGQVVGLSWKGIKKGLKQGAKWAVPGYAVHRALKKVYGGKAAPGKPAATRKYAPGVVAPSGMPTSYRAAAPGGAPIAEAQYAAPPVPPGLANQYMRPEATETTQMPLPSDEYYPEAPEEDEPYHAEDYDESEVSGWLYNRPYRDSATMLAQLQRSPGVAMSVREMYNRGLGRPPLNLEQLAMAALKG